MELSFMDKACLVAVSMIVRGWICMYMVATIFGVVEYDDAILCCRCVRSTKAVRGVCVCVARIDVVLDCMHACIHAHQPARNNLLLLECDHAQGFQVLR